MRIAFVWTGVTSYMADCWRRLAAESDVAVKVWIDTSSSIAKAVGFDVEKVMRGVTYKILNAEKKCAEEACFGGEVAKQRRSRPQGSARSREVEEIVTWKPDVLFVVGWRSAICRAVVEEARLKDVPKVCCFDMPWRWQLRCLAAPFVLWKFLRRYQAAFVPGAVCARYARWLGFRKVYRGLFAIDTERFQQFTKPDTLCSSRTLAGGFAVASQPPLRSKLLRRISPLRLNDNAKNINAEKQRNGGYFLYIGRDSAEKRLDDIRAAHRLYREQGGTLALRMYGKGLEGGFVKPEDVPALMQGAAAFVLASDFDPWPLVLLEAMAAGCPVIASDRCTNRPELGKNWRVFPVGDVKALACEMLGIGRVEVERWREENLALAQQYDCRAWVNRVKTIITDLRSSALKNKERKL